MKRSKGAERGKGAKPTDDESTGGGMSPQGTTDSTTFTTEERVLDRQAPLREEGGAAGGSSGRARGNASHNRFVAKRNHDEDNDADEGLDYEEFDPDGFHPDHSSDSIDDDDEDEEEDLDDDTSHSSASSSSYSSFEDQFNPSLRADENLICIGDLVYPACLQKRYKHLKKATEHASIPMTWCEKGGLGVVADLQEGSDGIPTCCLVMWHRPQALDFVDIGSQVSKYAECEELELLKIKRRGDGMETGEVVRNLNHPDGGLIVRARQWFWMEPSALHSVNVFRQALEATWDSTTSEQSSKKKKGKGGNKKEKEVPTSEAVKRQRSRVLPLSPFGSGNFIMSRIPEKSYLKGHVKEFYGDVLMMMPDMSLLVFKDFPEPIRESMTNVQGVRSVTVPSFTKDDTRVTYLIGQYSPEHSEGQGTQIYCFPRRVILTDIDGEQWELDPILDEPLVMAHFVSTRVAYGHYVFLLPDDVEESYQSHETDIQDGDLCTLDSVHFVDWYAPLLRCGRDDLSPQAGSPSSVNPADSTEVDDGRDDSAEAKARKRPVPALGGGGSSGKGKKKGAGPAGGASERLALLRKAKWMEDLKTVMEKFALIHKIVDVQQEGVVAWQDGTLEELQGEAIAVSARYDFPEDGMDIDCVETFVNDIVVPSSILSVQLQSQIRANECRQPSETSTTTAGTAENEASRSGVKQNKYAGKSATGVIPCGTVEEEVLSVPLQKSVCSRYDFTPFYPVQETELTCGDIVQPRVDIDVYLHNNLPAVDPGILGVLKKKKTGLLPSPCPPLSSPNLDRHFNAEEEWEVEWFEQRQETLRVPLPATDPDRGYEVEDAHLLAPLDEKQQDAFYAITKIPKDSYGEIVGLLPDTRVRVRWLVLDPNPPYNTNHMLETLCYRHEVTVAREAESDYSDDDEEGEEEEEEEDEAVEEAIHVIRAPEPIVADVDGSGAGPAAATGESTGRSIFSGARQLGAMFSSLVSSLTGANRTTPGNDSSHGSGAAAATSTSPDAESGASAGEDQNDTLGAASPSVLSEQFTVCSFFSRHHFLHSSEAFAPSNPRLFQKRVQSEWKILRTSLPPGVQVKVSEAHSHLLKFSIEGPIHTPYYQGLLCFDVQLPSDYPMAPPSCHFHSKALKMNPNLYEDGHICLSLLGTWEGSPEEGWLPATSNILQLVISIQGLILVKEPFYNEAGFDAKIGTAAARKLSKQYNEKVFLLHLQHLMDSASSNGVPDWSFEFRSHYLKVVPNILKRIKSYVRRFEEKQQQDAERDHEEEVQRAESTTLPPAAKAASLEGAGGRETTTHQRLHLHQHHHRTTESEDVEGCINSDGLVLPLSHAFVVALKRYIEVLENQYNELRPKWEKEMEAYNLPHFD